MGSANFIPQIIGLLFSIDAVGVPINTAIYRRMVEEFTESPALRYLGVILALFFGFSFSISTMRGPPTGR